MRIAVLGVGLIGGSIGLAAREELDLFADALACADGAFAETFVTAATPGIISTTLLLADDSVTIQRVIELTFADEGVRVIAVGDGETAIGDRGGDVGRVRARAAEPECQQDAAPHCAQSVLPRM